MLMIIVFHISIQLVVSVEWVKLDVELYISRNKT